MRKAPSSPGSRGGALERAGALVRAAHPEPSLAVTAFATALALGAGMPAGRVGLLASAVLAGQLSVGWGNDWVDAGADTAAGRRDKPLATGALPVAAVRGAALAALAGAVVLSLPLGARAAVVHLAGVGLGWAYDLRLKRTAASVAPYAGAFALLPVFVAAAAGGPVPWWAVGAGALLGAGGHFANVLPDLDADERTGVRGLPQRLGRRASATGAAVMLAGGAGVIALGRGALPPPGWALLVLGVALCSLVGVLGWKGRGAAAFTTSMLAAASVVALWLATGPALG